LQYLVLTGLFVVKQRGGGWWGVGGGR
jgi:hypothetical protein